MNSSRNTLTPQMMRLNKLIYAFKIKYKLNEIEADELKEEAYIKYAEAINDSFISINFFEKDGSISSYLEEYMIPIMRKWLRKYRSIDEAESVVYDKKNISISFEEIVQYSVENYYIDQMDREDLYNIFKILRTTDNIKMFLNILYGVRNRSTVVFADEYANKVAIKLAEIVEVVRAEIIKRNNAKAQVR